MTCDVCQGSKTIRVPTYRDVAATGDNDFDSLPEVVDPPYKEFDCPQCVPRVPYRRVRAMRVVTAYPAEQYGKFQMPIERSMAARFGEYLLREGLITFASSGSKDFGKMGDKIVVTARLGVVSREDAIKAGAVPEVATTAPPKPRMSDGQKRKLRIRVEREVVTWTPPGDDELITDEFDEPKDALASRFSGLEIG